VVPDAQGKVMGRVFGYAPLANREDPLGMLS
jgi:hypothetical protein